MGIDPRLDFSPREEHVAIFSNFGLNLLVVMAGEQRRVTRLCPHCNNLLKIQDLKDPPAGYPPQNLNGGWCDRCGHLTTIPVYYRHDVKVPLGGLSVPYRKLLVESWLAESQLNDWECILYGQLVLNRITEFLDACPGPVMHPQAGGPEAAVARRTQAVAQLCEAYSGPLTVS